jgi:hypothetical protein
MVKRIVLRRMGIDLKLKYRNSWNMAAQDIKKGPSIAA